VKETESNIVSSICDYLALKQYFFWRQNTAPAVQKRASGWAFRKMPKHSKKGVPDIIIIKQPTGQFVGLEVKREEGKQSPDQKDFERESKAAGAQYHVVRSIDDVIALGL
jgi:hypothetical protein